MKPNIGTSPAYLFWNSYNFCFRLKIPKDIRTFFDGKRELRSSLKTANLTLAKQKARYLAGNIQWLFEILRRNRNKMDKLTDAQMQQMINRFIRNKLDEFERSRIEDGWTEPSQVEHNDKMLKGMIEMNQADLVQTEYMNARGSVEKILEREGVTLDSESFEYKALCREYLLSEIEMYKLEKNRNVSDYSDDVDELFPISGDEPTPTESIRGKAQEVEPDSITLEELWEEYKDVKIKTKRWRKGTVRNHRPKFNSLIQFIGNIPVNRITKEMIREYRKLLDHLPPYFATTKEYKDLSGIKPSQIKGKHKEILDISTIRDYMTMAKAIFQHAEDSEYIVSFRQA